MSIPSFLCTLRIVATEDRAEAGLESKSNLLKADDHLSATKVD
jgi:hypothetical protein